MKIQTRQKIYLALWWLNIMLKKVKVNYTQIEQQDTYGLRVCSKLKLIHTKKLAFKLTQKWLGISICMLGKDNSRYY